MKPSISCLTVERIDSSFNNSMRLGPTLNPFGLAMQDFEKNSFRSLLPLKVLCFYFNCHLSSWHVFVFVYPLFIVLSLSYKAGRIHMQLYFFIVETMVPCHVFLNLQCRVFFGSAESHSDCRQAEAHNHYTQK